MAKKHHGHHTGPIHHADMKSHQGLNGMGRKDPHASAEHHAANKKHGMPHGMSHHGDGCMEDSEGGEGMAGNCSYE